MTAAPLNASAPLALTMGEPGGVGGEITVKAWRALKDSGSAFVLYGDPACLSPFDAPVARIDRPEAAHEKFRDAIPLVPLEAGVNPSMGRASSDNAPAVIESIERAVQAALTGAVSGVVTNPIQKSSLADAGFRFPGHTEFIADLCKSTPLDRNRARGPVMMLAGPELRTAPATVHLPLREAVRAINADRLVHIGRVVNEALRFDFGVLQPRLAFAGLNPHAGERGVLGEEDEAIIAPAVAALADEGLHCVGPLPADTMFHDDARTQYDAAICMYHDQALIPVKTLDFHRTVNLTLGLPIVRTSPDHGTALDIAGRGDARADSLIAALRLAGEIATRRAR